MNGVRAWEVDEALYCNGLFGGTWWGVGLLPVSTADVLFK